MVQPTEDGSRSGAWIADYVDAAAAALSLPIAPAHRPGVIRYLEIAAGFAARVEAVPLSPHDESAVRFEPVVPRGDLGGGQ